jgi:hypothetical protein
MLCNASFQVIQTYSKFIARIYDVWILLNTACGVTKDPPPASYLQSALLRSSGAKLYSRAHRLSEQLDSRGMWEPQQTHAMLIFSKWPPKSSR